MLKRIILAISIFICSSAFANNKPKCELRLPPQCLVDSKELKMKCDTDYVKLEHEDIAGHYFLHDSIPGTMTIVFWKKDYIELYCEHGK